MCRTVTQVVDNSGKEETECKGRQAQRVETKTVEVDLWVLECLSDTSPGKLFVSSSVAIILESCENVFPLLGSEKPGSCGVTMDEEVRSNGHDDSQQTLLERRVNRRVENWSGKTHDYEDPPPTSQTPNSFHFGKGKRLELFERYVEEEAGGCLTNNPPNAPERLAAETNRAMR